MKEKMEKCLRFLMRKRVLAPLTAIVTSLAGWVFYPDSPKKVATILVVSGVAFLVVLFPRIPPEDMRKPY